MSRHATPARPEDLLRDPDSHREPAPTPAPRAPRPVRVSPLGGVFAGTVALVLFLWFFDSVTFVLLLLLAAAALASLLRPIAQHVPGPRWLRGTVTGAGLIVVLVVVLALVAWALTGAVSDQVQQWPQIKQNLDQGLQAWANRLGLQTTVSVDRLRDQAIGWLTGGEGGDLVSQAAEKLGALLIGGILLLFGALYFLAERTDGLVRGLESLLPGRERALRAALNDLSRHLRWWLLGTLISVVVSGTLQVVGYSLVGLNYALAIGLFAGLAEFIPTFGPAAAYLVALLIASTQGTQTIIGVTVVYLLAQTIESYIIVPLVMQRAVNIHPLVTLFTIVLWGRLLGPLGLFLAIPIDLTLWTFTRHFFIRPPADHPPP